MPRTRCPSSEKAGMSPGRLAAGCLLGLLLTLLLTLGGALLLQREVLPLTACVGLARSFSPSPRWFVPFLPRGTTAKSCCAVSAPPVCTVFL